MSSGTSRQGRHSSYEFPKLSHSAPKRHEKPAGSRPAWSDLLAIGGLLALAGMILFLAMRG